MSNKWIFDDCANYGRVLAAFEDQKQVFHSPAAAGSAVPLAPADATTFLHSAYALLETGRELRIYRLSETMGLCAPYGQDHASYLRGMIGQRRPAKLFGRFWTPARPALLLDSLGVASYHYEDVRRGAAVLREWNRFDFCVEARLPLGCSIYAGRVAPQSENRAFQTENGRTIRYGGGAMQFIVNLGDVVLEAFYEVR